MLTVKDHLEYLRKIGKFPDQPPPKRFVFTFVGKFFRELIAAYPCEPYPKPFAGVYRLADELDTAFGNFKIGAAANAMKMDQLIYWGVKEFFAIGLAGAIAPDLRPGDIVLAEEALRDEGVSHHYVGPGEKIGAPGASLSIWEKALSSHKVRRGVILSHDAIYRLTEKKFREKQKEGVLAVEMETAALYAVGECYRVPIATALVISDFESPNGWELAFDDPKVLEGQFSLFRALLQPHGS